MKFNSCFAGTLAPHADVALTKAIADNKLLEVAVQKRTCTVYDDLAFVHRASAERCGCGFGSVPN